jgi:hypothetical protein
MNQINKELNKPTNQTHLAYERSRPSEHCAETAKWQKGHQTQGAYQAHMLLDPGRRYCHSGQLFFAGWCRLLLERVRMGDNVGRHSHTFTLMKTSTPSQNNQKRQRTLSHSNTNAQPHNHNRNTQQTHSSLARQQLHLHMSLGLG